MTNSQLTAQQLSPIQTDLQDATVKALQARVEPAAVQKFLNDAVGGSAPAPIGATASLNMAIWGKLTCDPDGQPWNYDIGVWGFPGYFGASAGFMYTAYNTWDQFFASVASAHCQGVASGGGILQINWLDGNGTPVGQFNGVSGGIGAVEAGGWGAWQKK